MRSFVRGPAPTPASRQVEPAQSKVRQVETVRLRSSMPADDCLAGLALSALRRPAWPTESPTAQRVADGAPVGPAPQETGRFDPLAKVRMPNRTGLPDRLKANVEALSGLSMDDVHVHRNSPKPAQLQALAYAQGTEIHLGPGQERHLPHEAWHVVQQKQGRVKATTQMKGVGPPNDDRDLMSVAQRMERPSKRLRTEEVDSSAEHSDFDASEGVIIDGEGQIFCAYSGSREVGRLELYCDDKGRYWINNVHVDDDMRRRGIATRLIESAIYEHKAIYAAEDMTEDDEVNSEDTRHLQDDGRQLVEGLIDKGVLNEDWYFNPREEASHSERLEEKRRAEKREKSDSEDEERRSEAEETMPTEDSEEERLRQEAAEKSLIAKGYRISKN